MIERYTRPEMGQIWNVESKFATWLEVELAACEAWSEHGLFSKAEFSQIRERAKFDLKRIAEAELEVKHDVLAFLTSVNESLGPDLSRWVHYGLTSSDVLDTAFALQMTRALDLILAQMNLLGEALAKRAHEFKDTIQIGRSHGIHAEPITFGLKLALYYDELTRNVRRLRAARENIAIGKLSGAVGTYAHLPPSVEKATCKKLKLTPANLATQVIQRDHHAEVFTSLAILGGSLEKIAVEIRHLQRTELREAEEPFTRGQKGSSAMPHKRNPIASENITGCARLLRSYAGAALENIALWHERDISHSSVERVIAPDATILAHYMLHRLTGVIRDLVVYPQHMAENLAASRGLIFSQKLMLELVAKGMPREAAYKLVQASSMRVWDEDVDFRKVIEADPTVQKYLNPAAIGQIFNVQTYIVSRDEIFKRIFTH